MHSYILLSKDSIYASTLFILSLAIQSSSLLDLLFNLYSPPLVISTIKSQASLKHKQNPNCVKEDKSPIEESMD